MTDANRMDFAVDTDRPMDRLYPRLRDELGHRHPDLWAKVYPRAYRDAGDWTSPKVPATMLGHAVQAARVQGDLAALPPSTRQLYLQACMCAERMMPTYFVARPLVEAVMRTNPPPDLRWEDLPLPHEALTLMLPSGTLRHEREGEIGAITLARVPVAQPLRFPAIGAPQVKLPATVLIATGCAHEWPTMPIYDLTLNAGTTPTIGSVEEIHAGTDTTFDAEGNIVAQPTTLADAQVAQSLMSLALRIVLVMSARPELVEPGVQTGAQKKRGGALTYWTPTVVGRTYRTRIDAGLPPVGSHASPRLHWRRGHYAAQPYGPQWSKRKIIWREPTIVGDVPPAP